MAAPLSRAGSSNRKLTRKLSLQTRGESESCLISASELASYMQQEHRILVVDCRSFLKYNSNHIRGALNVSCSSKFKQKRLISGKLKLVDLISPAEAREEWSDRKSHVLVMYDEDSNDEIRASSALQIVLKLLRDEGTYPLILHGGLVEFQAQHASLVHTAALQLATCPTSHTPRPEEHPISKVLPYLFLGNERDSMSAEKLRQHCITSVINVTQATPMPPAEAEVRALRLPAADNGTQNLRQYFDEAFAFIESVRAEGGILLVHCYAGISRSATVTIAYLMKFHNMSLTDAYNFVKKCRPVISPNLNFMGQLLQLEEELAAERGVAPSAPGLTSINCGTVPPPPTPNTPTFHNSDLATGRLLSKATCKLPAIRDDELCGATAEALDISDEPKRDKILHPTGGGDLLESSEYSSTPPL